ncbi:RNA polymerase sigma factor [Marinicella meishanensis]|uniref:RNA polymerase sigma factor n=1 Tax=Marinicella meishanensis TaxID=2873263 RepID=UPI001CBD2AB7|nr:RNA polymerase sigma factor [Marinicella sp. NBU2979]
MKTEKVYIEYLLLQAQQGNRQAGEDLLAVLQNKVRAFAHKFLGGSAAVDDCVQESLLKIHRQIKQLRAVKAIHTWVYRIVHSTCMDQLRQQAKTKSSTPDDPTVASNLDQQLDVKAAIAQLSEEQQVIIYLFYYEGFTVSEMAEVLGRPAGTIKYLLFAAREQIKSTLQHEESNHEHRRTNQTSLG